MTIRILALVALATFAIDFLTKWFVLAVLRLRAGDGQGYDLAADALWGAALDLTREFPVLPPLLQFRMLWNPGINFGIAGSADMRWVLVGLSVAISLGLIVWILRRGQRNLTWGVGLVIGGALGNALDRVVYGAVADFLNMSCCGIDNPYSFNVADIAIFAGALWIVWRA